MKLEPSPHLTVLTVLTVLSVLSVSSAPGADRFKPRSDG
jgi:hypothetical protein